MHAYIVLLNKLHNYPVNIQCVSLAEAAEDVFVIHWKPYHPVDIFSAISRRKSPFLANGVTITRRRRLRSGCSLIG